MTGSMVSAAWIRLSWAFGRGRDVRPEDSSSRLCEWEISADLQQEWWKAPIYQNGQQNDTAATFQITWFPEVLATQH